MWQKRELWERYHLQVVKRVGLIFAGRREMLLRFWRASLPVCYREVQGDRRPAGSLELHGRRGSRRGLKYPRSTLVGKRWGRGKKGKGRLKVACLKMVLTPFPAMYRVTHNKCHSFNANSVSRVAFFWVQGTQLRS